MGAGSGSRYEGDPGTQGLQLADVVALGALGVDVGVVKSQGPGRGSPGWGRPAGARRWPGSRGPPPRSPSCAAAAGDAPIALPKKVSVRPAATAASPTTRARYG